LVVGEKSNTNSFFSVVGVMIIGVLRVGVNLGGEYEFEDDSMEKVNLFGECKGWGGVVVPSNLKPPFNEVTSFKGIDFSSTCNEI